MEKNTVESKITMSIDAVPHAEMMAYAQRFSPDECSGVGLVERIDYDDGSIEFKITEVFLPNQYNSAVDTNIPEDELNKLNTSLVMEDKDTSLLKFHWHSHVDMSVFHSGTDDDNYDEMQTGDYAVSLVVNKKGDMLGSVHLYNPLRISVCNIEIEPPDTIEVDDAKVTGNVSRVKENEPLLRKQHEKVTYRPYSYVDDYYNGGSLEYLAHDPDFEELLVQGEKIGIITLFRDSFEHINGYMNNTTGHTYALCSDREYSYEKGGFHNDIEYY